MLRAVVLAETKGDGSGGYTVNKTYLVRLKRVVGRAVRGIVVPVRRLLVVTFCHVGQLEVIRQPSNRDQRRLIKRTRRQPDGGLFARRSNDLGCAGDVHLA